MKTLTPSQGKYCQDEKDELKCLYREWHKVNKVFGNYICMRTIAI